jgi:hypothetical protein
MLSITDFLHPGVAVLIVLVKAGTSFYFSPSVSKSSSCEILTAS